MNEASIFLFVFFGHSSPSLFHCYSHAAGDHCVQKKTPGHIYILERNGIASHARLKKCKKKEEMKESSWKRINKYLKRKDFFLLLCSSPTLLTYEIRDKPFSNGAAFNTAKMSLMWSAIVKWLRGQDLDVIDSYVSFEINLNIALRLNNQLLK